MRGEVGRFVFPANAIFLGFQHQYFTEPFSPKGRVIMAGLWGPFSHLNCGCITTDSMNTFELSAGILLTLECPMTPMWPPDLWYRTRLQGSFSLELSRPLRLIVSERGHSKLRILTHWMIASSLSQPSSE